MIFGTDEENEVTTAVVEHLEERGLEVVELEAGMSWSSVGRTVGQAVAAGAADVGVVCCWTGTGVSMAANKVPGIRAALCTDAQTAGGARRWNDANVLALGLRLTSKAVAKEIIDAFLDNDPDPAEAANISDVEPAPR